MWPGIFRPRSSQTVREALHEMSALENRFYLTLRQNWAHSCRASRVAWVGWKWCSNQGDPQPRPAKICTPSLYDRRTSQSRASMARWPASNESFHSRRASWRTLAQSKTRLWLHSPRHPKEKPLRRTVTSTMIMEEDRDLHHDHVFVNKKLT